MELSISTPALLFSAISLLVLALTNRFLALAQLVRTLAEQYQTNPSPVIAGQIANIRKRVHLVRVTQFGGLLSLLLCIITMGLIYFGLMMLAEILFAVALLSLIISLIYSMWEIQISVKALDLHLSNMEKKE
jgi:uncharacterized membrane protein